jgi:hypothetical protein
MVIPTFREFEAYACNPFIDIPTTDQKSSPRHLAFAFTRLNNDEICTPQVSVLHLAEAKSFACTTQFINLLLDRQS